ncbi:glycosyltransferase family 2 protein [uncultured Methanobrevibacter sp.]|uniref:glycosyltransferase family 2 protein n=1 Tax=uncultured Methanobrevibacter sp. TaxID=253161 RepID=UPI0025DC935A|nr:glycosyltransferase family 2 protein [uncultured Methanobrevibacter sp.]
MVKVSVVMPVYDINNLIEKSIESVNNQSLKDIELICISTNSGYNSHKLLDDLSKKYDFIKILSGVEKGSSAARNLAISSCSGEYIAFLNPGDIFIDKGALNKLYKKAKKFDADMVSANLKILDSKGKLIEDPRYKANDLEYFFIENVMRPKHYGLPWAYYKNIYKKDMLIKNNIKFPNLTIGEGPVFLSEVLTTISEVYIMSIDYYGLLEDNEEYFNKFKNSNFKYDYMEHYKRVIKVLAFHKFKKNSNRFRKLLLSDLKYAIENNDTDIYKGFKDAFHNHIYILGFLQNNAYYFNAYFLIRMIRECKTVEEFYNYKDELIEMDLIRKHYLPKDLLFELIFIFSSKNFEDYKLHIDEFLESLNNGENLYCEDDLILYQK